MRIRNCWRIVLCAMLLAIPACSGGDAASAPEVITADELAAEIAAGNPPIILDVRTEEEFAAGHIPGAINIPHTELTARLDELPADHQSPIVVHCQSGRRAEAAMGMLHDAGFAQIIDLDGDMAAWREGNHPVE